MSIKNFRYPCTPQGIELHLKPNTVTALVGNIGVSRLPGWSSTLRTRFLATLIGTTARWSLKKSGQKSGPECRRSTRKPGHPNKLNPPLWKRPRKMGSSKNDPHDPHGGIIEIHNPLKNGEKWGFLNISTIRYQKHEWRSNIVDNPRWTHNPLKNDEKWGPKCPRSSWWNYRNT